MDFKVVFTETFCEYLERTFERIAEQNPAAASKLGTLVVDACERLNFFPERHPRVRQRPGIRRLIVAKHYKVFYRVKHKTRRVEILRCRDGRRGSDPSVGRS
jgi:plasmid stabilization system protein ParE